MLVGFGFLCGCSGSPPEGTTIRRAENLTFYEGLPKPIAEAALLDAEKKAKPTVELHGHPFYRQTLVWKAGDEEKAKDLLGDVQSYKPYSDTKVCPPFHADYAIGWAVEGKQYVCLICLSCGESWVYGPAGGAHHEFPSDARERIEGLLGSYRHNRPPHDI